MTLSQKITPCLLFDGKAEKAAKFYTSIFKKSKIITTSPLTTTFRLEDQEFIALNGPRSDFTWAISFFVTCRTQKEIDYFWKELSAGGETQQCGWLKDKFGVSWQIVPAVLSDLLDDDDAEKAERAMQAMLQMKKLDIAKLKKAHAGR